MAYMALMVFVCALFLLVTSFCTSHDDLMVVGICWIPTGTEADSPVFLEVFEVVEVGEMF